MDGRTYLAIFQENGLVRSDLVKILEHQVKVFQENNMPANAEEAKWLAIEIAEEEKAQGYPFLKGNETREQIAERYLNARGKM